jgi:hypothetical protein
MDIMKQRALFDASKKVYESTKVTFIGVEGFDVYNPSIPFNLHNKTYIFGRVERRNEWARSWVRLFEHTGNDTWTLVPHSMIYPLEDPYVSIIGNTLVLGGTHVRYKQSHIDTYYGYFYKGTDINNMYYFTTGPDYMKDIRLVEMPDQRIGVFSRPRNAETYKKYGCESMIGFTIINSLDDLTAEVVENAPYIPDLFAQDEWGGCNQAYCLSSGMIGVIGHKSYKHKNSQGQTVSTYLNLSFIFDPVAHKATDVKIIGTRPCYPDGPAKKRPDLVDCAFTSGIVMRDDGKVDLYSGIGDCEVGRIVIDYPFSGFGSIVSPCI